MGLSQRRRAKKSTRSSQLQMTVSTTQENASSTADCCRQHPLTNRTGNTLRRVCPDTRRELKRVNLLALQVSRKPNQSEVLMPTKPTEHPEVGAQPNANLYNKKMIHLVDNDFTSDVCYSLNKRGRWQIAQRLREEYEVCDDLRGQNFCLTESTVVLKPGRSSYGVKAMTSNTMYMNSATAELRDHQRKQLEHEKRHLAQVDQFEFSEAASSAKTNRPLTHIVATTGHLNVGSILETPIKNRRKKPAKLSPSAEIAHRELTDDYENRMDIAVGTCEPGLDAGSARCRMAENAYSFEKRFGKPLKDFRYNHAKLIESMIRQDRRCQLELQLDMDAMCTEELLDMEAEEENEETGISPARRHVTVGEAMQPMADVSINRAKKQALKALKMKQAEAAQRKKLRSESGQTATSSGYDSISSEFSDEAQQATETADAVDKRVSLALEVELAIERPLMQVSRKDASPASLFKVFEGAEQSLVIGNSFPRKLAILLCHDLSESVVFEEVVSNQQSNAEMTVFAVHYACSDSINFFKRKTSAEKVASQANPFEFLRQLIDAPSTSVPDVLGAAAARPIRITAWKRADAVMESDARLTAIRALPMFSVDASAQAATGECELVPSAECEICCQELLWLQEQQSLVLGSTMLNECGHTFCNSCWLQHVASSVARGRVGVTCPGFKCQTVLDAATLLWFCPCDMLAALSSAAYRVWISARPDGRQRRLCSQSRCGRVLECRAGFNAVCTACSRAQCLACGQEPHWPVDCATATKYHQKMKKFGHIKLELSDLLATSEVNAKQCPTCRAVIEKGIGCNHMTCNCGQHFCWWCGGRMEDHKEYFPCQNQASSKRAASAYFVEQVYTASDTLLSPNSLQSRLYCLAVRVRLHREQIQRHLSIGRRRIVELFATYLSRFGRKSGSFSDRRLEAEQQARHLTESVTQAVYLLEFTYAQADCHRVDRQVGKLVRCVGSLVWHLVENIAVEIRAHNTRGFAGPKQTKVVCERLQMLLECLKTRCRFLRNVAVGQRDAKLLVAGR